MADYHALLVETSAFKQPSTFRSIRLNVPEPELSGHAFDLQAADTGGAAYLSSGSTLEQDRVLLWEFTEEVKREFLTLAELTAITRAVQIRNLFIPLALISSAVGAASRHAPCDAK